MYLTTEQFEHGLYQSIGYKKILHDSRSVNAEIFKTRITDTKSWLPFFVARIEGKYIAALPLYDDNRAYFLAVSTNNKLPDRCETCGGPIRLAIFGKFCSHICKLH